MRSIADLTHKPEDEEAEACAAGKLRQYLNGSWDRERAEEEARIALSILRTSKLRQLLDAVTLKH